MDEVWKPIPGHGDRYEASSAGRVRRVKGKGCDNGKVRVLSQSAGTYGYVYTRFVYEGIHRIGTHILVASAFLGICPDSMEVNHIDMNKANNRLDNLEYVSHAENLRKARAMKSWGAKGEKTGNAKLKDNDVRAIRQSNLSERVLAKQYGVSQPCIHYIRQRKTWRHVLD